MKEKIKLTQRIIQEIAKLKDRTLPFPYTEEEIIEELFIRGFTLTKEDAKEVLEEYYLEYPKIKKSNQETFDEQNRKSNATEIKIPNLELKEYFFISYQETSPSGLVYLGNDTINIHPIEWQCDFGTDQTENGKYTRSLISWNPITKKQFEKYKDWEK